MVRIVYEPETAAPMTESGNRVKFPLVESDKPGSLHLTNEMIAEIFEEEDVARCQGFFPPPLAPPRE